jgi:hypothetical protein
MAKHIAGERPDRWRRSEILIADSYLVVNEVPVHADASGAVVSG